MKLARFHSNIPRHSASSCPRLLGVVEEVVLLTGWDGRIGCEAVSPFGEFVGVAFFGAGDGIFVDFYA